MSQSYLVAVHVPHDKRSILTFIGIMFIGERDVNYREILYPD